jgi:hypothetical protein
MPSVDVETGAVTPVGSEIEEGESFTWTCSAAASGTTITVTAQKMPDNQPWFSPSPTASFVTPNSSQSVTAEGVGDWAWTATGVVVGGSARVHIISTMPGGGKHEEHRHHEGHEHHEHEHHEHEGHEHREHEHKKAS